MWGSCPPVPAGVPADGIGQGDMAQVLQMLATGQQNMLARLEAAQQQQAAQAAQTQYVLPNDAFFTVAFQRIGKAVEHTDVQQRRDGVLQVVRTVSAMAAGGQGRNAQSLASVFAQLDASPASDPAAVAMQACYFAAQAQQPRQYQQAAAPAAGASGWGARRAVPRCWDCGRENRNGQGHMARTGNCPALDVGGAAVMFGSDKYKDNKRPRADAN